MSFCGQERENHFLTLENITAGIVELCSNLWKIMWNTSEDYVVANYGPIGNAGM